MANVLIRDLAPVGSGFFADAEAFTNSISDLSENELKMTFGGTGYKSSKSKSKSKKSKKSFSSRSSGGCYYPCNYHC
jgi:hypothetical protein